MKAVIVFHSMTGNTYIVAKAFEAALLSRGIETSLYRVEDQRWKPQTDVTEKAKQNLRAMMSLPVATPDVLLKSDIVIMGSPTYFGNVSAQMKAFQDATSAYWFESKLAGKRFAAFTSVGSPENGGSLCLQTMHFYAQHMGMIIVPVPNSIWPTAGLSAYGIVQNSQARYGEELDQKTVTAIERYVEVLTANA
jgi:NAD(P)H dehydrogenase (quinone)